ncbi:MAG: nuclear transport factor 2 family protein [Acidimicrobiia bacterium]
MTANLIEIGNQIRAAYATSMGDGHAAWLGHAGPGMQVFHVPELPGDGTPIDPEQVRAGAAAEVDALAKIQCRIDVETVRQAGDDLLILETVFTGTLPDGNDFRFDNVLLYTFRDGKIARLVEVASGDMWSTLSKALQEAAGYTGAAGRT